MVQLCTDGFSDDVIIQKKSSKIREQLQQLRTKYENHKFKNVEVLINAQQVSEKKVWPFLHS